MDMLADLPMYSLYQNKVPIDLFSLKATIKSCFYFLGEFYAGCIQTHM